jgi:hypothetical protein
MPRAALWGVLAALALPVLGCGDDDGGGGEGSSKELDQLVAALEEATTSPIRMTFEMRTDPDRGERVEMSGPAEMLGDRLRMRVRYDEAGETFAMEILQHEGVAWLRSESFDGLLPPGKSWIRSSDPAIVGGPGPLTPAQYGELIEEEGRVEDLGRERLDGTSARHLRATVQMSDLMEKAGATGILRAMGGTDIELPIDVWIGPDDRPVRMYMEIEGPEQAGGGEAMIDMTDFEYGVPVDLDPPPEDTVTDDSILK